MIEKYLINKNNTIKEALKKIDKGGKRIIFVIDDELKLCAALSDGNIRKHILKTGGINGIIDDICNHNPIYFGYDYNINSIKKIMLKEAVSGIPIVDENKKVVKILFWDDVFSGEKKIFTQIDLPVVIMAGGKGTRLDPFTRILPKPLIPIGDKSLIEIIMDEYAKFGMKNFYISIGHKGKMIRAYFEDHESDYSFQYINEDKPLGTAGALKYIEGKFNSQFFVSNCDIIIKDDYSKIYDFHTEGNYILTIVASMQNYIIPYGVCEIENGGTLKNINEKPEYNFLVNSGMYLLNPDVLKYIPENKFFHMTYLIEKLKKEGFQIGVYPVSEKSWIDVGQWDEYKRSKEIITEITKENKNEEM